MDAHRQERLVAALGHELRNPLAAALTGVSLVRELVESGDPREPILTQAVADLERVGRLVASFLDFSRAQRPRRGPVDLADVARTVAARRADRVVCAGQDCAPTAGDAALLERVLENLVENALGVGATRVELRVLATEDEVHVDVADNGPGVPEPLRDRLFEPTVSGRGSSGLGLAIAADVVAAHGGRISLRPDAAGIAGLGATGAVFRVSLPLEARSLELCAEVAP